MNALVRRTTIAGLVATLAGSSACSNDSAEPLGGGSVAQTAILTVTLANVSAYDFLASGAQSVAVGATDPGPIGPGGAYEISFHAGPNMKLSFAAMFVQSNDLFYAPGEAGIALFDAQGDPVSGNISSQVMLWDAGTELNEEPGLGISQAPRQSAADTGVADSDNTVRLASNDFGNLPASTADVLSITLTPGAGNMFTLRIENISSAGQLATSDSAAADIIVAPLAWVLHAADAPLFSAGQADRAEGLEALAEDGGPSSLVASLAERTGLNTPLAPGVYAIHREGEPLFSAGAADRGEGLERLSEDGDPSALIEALAADSMVSHSGTFSTPSGTYEESAALPESSYSFTFKAGPGDALSFATMLVQSNDRFLAPGPGGLALFDSEGNPRTGSVTADIRLWDTGTEVDEAPGAGPNQAPRQAGPDTGAAQDGLVEEVTDDAWPAASDVLEVTIEAN